MNILDILFKTTPQEPKKEHMFGWLGDQIVKDYIYNPDTKKILPNSMMNNTPDLTKGKLSNEDLQNIASIILPSPKLGRSIPVKGMKPINLPPRNVVSITDLLKGLGGK